MGEGDDSFVVVSENSRDYRATARVEQMGDLEEEGGRYAARKVGVGWPSMVKCQRCRVVRWVCENHPDKPWDRDHEQICGGAGMPCPVQRAARG